MRDRTWIPALAVLICWGTAQAQDKDSAQQQPATQASAQSPPKQNPAPNPQTSAQNPPKQNPVPRPQTQAQSSPKDPAPTPAGQAPGKDPAPGDRTTGPVSGPAPQTVTPVRVPTAILEQPVRGRVAHTTTNARWDCEGRRCEAVRLDLRDFYDACAPLAQIVGPVVSFQSVELALNAQEIQRCNSPIVQSLYVMACSGPDDLRQQSVLKMGWQVDGRNFTPDDVRQVLFTEIARNECRSVNVTRGLLLPFPLMDFRRVHFLFEGGRRVPTDSLDDWDMRQLIVMANVTRAGGTPLTVPLIRMEGSATRHRFEDVDRWSVDVPRGAVSVH